MTVIELLVFLSLCTAVAFIGQLIASRWGWLLGAIPFLLLCLILVFFEIRNLYKAVKGALSRGTRH